VDGAAATGAWFAATMSHPNEDRLRELYAAFARGDMEGFLDGCTDDVTFTVPGTATVSGEFTKGTFGGLVAPVMEVSGGTFREDVLDVFANDEHGVLLLLHSFDRDGQRREYRTAHIVQLRDGKIAKWQEHPGSPGEFEEAWGTAAVTQG
jgi:ketosteroid isomerase-like protein